MLAILNWLLYNVYINWHKILYTFEQLTAIKNEIYQSKEPVFFPQSISQKGIQKMYITAPEEGVTSFLRGRFCKHTIGWLSFQARLVADIRWKTYL